MPTLEVNGTELYYEERGDGPPLLLIHGTGGYAEPWAPVLDGLARSYRVISYDRRGFARSAPEPARRFSEHARDAAVLLEALDAVPAAVVGWSGGGIVALDLAASDPAAVTELFLAEAAVHLATRPRRAMVGMQVRAFFHRYPKRDAGAAAHAMYRWASRSTAGGNTFDTLPQAWQDQMLAHAASTVCEMDQIVRPYPSRKAIRSITCPVTLIEGELSDPVFPAANVFLGRLLPQARVVPLPGAAHFLHIDQPESWVEAISPA